MANRSGAYYTEEEASGKLARKAKDSPFLVVGLAGLVGICGVAAYKFRNRGNMPISIFLIQTRVAAQGAVIGSLTIGMTYHMINKWILHNGEDE